jgi:hypothetical protein
LHAFDGFAAKASKFWATVIDRWQTDGSQHAVRHWAWAGDL